MTVVPDSIMATMNTHQVEYILLGGMNFLLRHQPVLTYDVDVWIQDTPENRTRCEQALIAMEAEWGKTDTDWGPVSRFQPGWLELQGVFACATKYGALDIFRKVKGLDSWECCRSRAETCSTASGTAFQSLCDADMLACQYALEESLRKMDRVRYLEGLNHDG